MKGDPKKNYKMFKIVGGNPRKKAKNEKKKGLFLPLFLQVRDAGGRDCWSGMADPVGI